MADTLLNLQAGTLPEDWCWPATPQELNTSIMAIGKAVFPGTLTSFNFGDAEPDVADRDKPWIRTVGGIMEGLYVWNSTAIAWTRPHPTPCSSAERRLYRGDKTSLLTYDGGENTAVTTFTGPFWEIDTDFGSDSNVFRVPIGVGKNPTTYDGSQLNIGLGDTGGVERHALTANEIPQHAHDMIWDQQDTSGGGQSNTVYNGADGGSVVDGISKPTAVNASTQLSHPNLPPYLGVYFIKRTARIHYRV